MNEPDQLTLDHAIGCHPNPVIRDLGAAGITALLRKLQDLDDGVLTTSKPVPAYDISRARHGLLAFLKTGEIALPDRAPDYLHKERYRDPMMFWNENQGVVWAHANNECTDGYGTYSPRRHAQAVAEGNAPREGFLVAADAPLPWTFYDFALMEVDRLAMKSADRAIARRERQIRLDGIAASRVPKLGQGKSPRAGVGLSD